MRGKAVLALIFCFFLLVTAADQLPFRTQVVVPAPVRADNKLVFAHYFPPYPVSVDNRRADQDYYATEWLSPTGENGRAAPYGGSLRDRPLPRPPRPEAGWRQSDLEDEVRQAVSAGIDGFTLDLLTTGHSTEWIADVPELLTRAAHAVAPGFKIMLMPDMNGELGSLSPAALADEIARLADHPGVYHLADGRLVVSPYLAENHSASWWADFRTYMQHEHGISVALVPVFADNLVHADFVPVSYGMSTWGGRNPAFNPTAGFPITAIAAAHRRGMVWMQPVSVQDYRPAVGMFDEAENTTNLRNTWNIAIAGHSDWVQLVTWNDYSEGTAFAPSVHHGSAFLDISAYYGRIFKGGKRAPRNEEVVLTHRTQLLSSRPSYPQTTLMTVRWTGTRARDAVEALTLLTAPARVTIRIGQAEHSCDVGAGASVCTMPMNASVPDGAAVSTEICQPGRPDLTAQSAWRITAHPLVQDVQYTATVGTRS